MLSWGSVCCCSAPQPMLDLSSFHGKLPMYGQGKPDAPPAVLFFCPHKTGSVFVERLLQAVRDVSHQCHFRIDHYAGKVSCATYSKCTEKGKAPAFASGLDVEPLCTTWTLKLLQAAADPDASSPPERAPLLKHGFMWGPIRQSLDASAVLDLAGNLRLTGFRPALIFHRRHPLDQLVSEYHSFGFQHPPPIQASEEALERFHAMRQRIQTMTIDEYVQEQLQSEEWWRVRYGALLHALRSPALLDHIQVVHSKYEDMVLHFRQWLVSILSVFTAWDDAHRNQVAEELELQFAESFKPDGRHKHRVWPGKWVVANTTHQHLFALLQYTLLPPYADKPSQDTAFSRTNSNSNSNSNKRTGAARPTIRRHHIHFGR
ncbi:hypothetical protein PTSG_01678 [Salpingoeca rosetta]|uniref:Sulfotransferase domain-containing protein n=1 Tax=Salpingoeca rosetta (strain ATCC 50818 / BSB-021) TaxID=946362 RepID=F2TYM5_SALR5|nr:uncharacterized protein PTSG_01678 [Salpingoeca rosetta]EGD78699.1 hypothetical protein PTSG_01678 [Salpingoeca rosetta]|eukprot:XP_004997656.1 hypothetical protein PTSG_01678 [Salpingoeca rosetta]